MTTATSTLTAVPAARSLGTRAPLAAPFPSAASPAARPGEQFLPRTAAGERAVRRRRARVNADRRPPSGVLPSSNRTAAVVTADSGDRVADRPFRMGRWARLFSTASVTIAAVAVGLALLSAGDRQVMGEVTVAPGDSLWSIAQQADPGADPRATVDQIRQLNGLSGDAIAVGAVLQVPKTDH